MNIFRKDKAQWQSDMREDGLLLSCVRSVLLCLSEGQSVSVKVKPVPQSSCMG